MCVCVWVCGFARLFDCVVVCLVVWLFVWLCVCVRVIVCLSVSFVVCMFVNLCMCSYGCVFVCYLM